MWKMSNKNKSWRTKVARGKKNKIEIESAGSDTHLSQCFTLESWFYVHTQFVHKGEKRLGESIPFSVNSKVQFWYFTKHFQNDRRIFKSNPTFVWQRHRIKFFYLCQTKLTCRCNNAVREYHEKKEHIFSFSHVFYNHYSQLLYIQKVIDHKMKKSKKQFC